MTEDFSFNNPEFDQYASEYDAALARGISVSGEDKNYFARGRIAWLSNCLRHLQAQPKFIMDFGCGTGSSGPFLLDLLGGEGVVGVDTSRGSVEVARKIHGSPAMCFSLLDEYRPEGQVDLAYCNGVFHHIPPAQRPAAVAYVHRSLRSDGLFSFWENNPWNPATRYVMSRIPFDREAVTLTPPEARRLLKANGFEVLRTDFLFIFPRALRWFRGLEPAVSRLPFGTQYQILCRRV